jgi:hypothetical protein
LNTLRFSEVVVNGNRLQAGIGKEREMSLEISLFTIFFTKLDIIFLLSWAIRVSFCNKQSDYPIKDPADKICFTKTMIY